MATLFLFDTNLLVHLVRGDAMGEEIKAEYAPFTRDPKPLICVVTDGELRSLALQFGWGAPKLNQMEFVLGCFGRVPIELRDVLETYAALDAHSKSQGIKMGKNDLWIAAAAYITGTRLVTTDDDFDHLNPTLLLVERRLYRQVKS
ncbi:MAG: PIN domain-containing protein [Acidobacteria bacterium]|nr:PIN domain-containing protein [Acidobacteriota bacterium]MBI3426715.1 PIN domain-containing protein [Acidobacteriota bacterium]